MFILYKIFANGVIIFLIFFKILFEYRNWNWYMLWSIIFSNIRNNEANSILITIIINTMTTAKMSSRLILWLKCEISISDYQLHQFDFSVTTDESSWAEISSFIISSSLCSRLCAKRHHHLFDSQLETLIRSPFLPKRW